MNCEFSETQFVFGILRELVTHNWTSGKGWSNLAMPTQRKERTLGYDFTIRGPVRTLFFQFKVPERITTPRGTHWKEFYRPYYKFKIWPDNKTSQHNQLKKLAQADSHNRVYYCAPRFYTDAEFEQYYIQQKISKQSVYVPCGTLKKISGTAQHDICYTDDPSITPVMYSEPYPVNALDLEGLTQDAAQTTPYEDINECFRKLEKNFELDIGNAETTAEKFGQIADQLLMKKNLNLMLLGDA